MRSLLQSISQFVRGLFKRPSGHSLYTDARDTGARSVKSRSQLSQAGELFGASDDTSGHQPVDSRISPSLRRLLSEATYRMPTRKRTHAAQVGALLRKQDRSFSYEKYHFTKLIDLLEALPDLVALERVDPTPDDRGVAPVYYVRPVTDVKQLITSALDRQDSPEGWVHTDSLKAAIASQAPRFSSQTHGYPNFNAFLESRTDLIEFKADSPSYLRLRRQRATRSKTFRKPRVRLPTKGVSTETKTEIKAPDSRVQKRVRIEPLLQFAGFSQEVLHQKVGELAAIALSERWYFGPKPPDDFAYPILKSYLRYTFIRLQHEGKAIASENHTYRAFNTGLVDTLLRPIYALFEQPTAPNEKVWNLTFCIASEGIAGKTLVAQFPQLPLAANYLRQPERVFYDLAAGAPQVDWQHVVKDNMARLPLAFLEKYAPAGFTPQSTQGLSTSDFFDYKRSFIASLEADPSAYRTMVSQLEDALTRTLRRTQINYKTAVPTYYPKINSVDLLLPICLVDESTVDFAIVTRREPSGKYIGHTILTLRQAYNNARLICKLDEHWLPKAMAFSQDAETSEIETLGVEPSAEPSALDDISVMDGQPLEDAHTESVHTAVLSKPS
ncbi:MAG: DUF3825 domain-containing protein [Cyanobacteria bacterium J06597_16]